MIAATLFSGIGAPETAMPHWQWPWHAEIEKFPSAVLAARHSDSINLGDVSANDFGERATAIAQPDVLVFGSPCQSFSVAGKRLGLDDTRGNLALVALRLVGSLRPRWFVFENVPGLLSSDGGRDFGAFLGLISELGYRGVWRVLDAQYFGVAQRRRRLFFVGCLGDWRRAAAVLFEPEGMRGDSPPRRQAGQNPAPTIASRPTGGGGLGTDFDCDGGLIASTGDVSHCLNAGGMGRIDYETETMVAHALRADGFDASEDGTGRGTPLVSVGVTIHGTDKTAKVASFTDVAGSLRTKPPGSQENSSSTAVYTLAVRGREGGHDLEYRQDGTANAILTPNGGRAGIGVGAVAMPAVAFNWQSGGDCRGLEPKEFTMALHREQTPATQVGSSVRRLTPRECERLQGFPDDYTLIEYRGKPAADGPRYKSLGNSMAVPVMRWILSRIEMMESK